MNEEFNLSRKRKQLINEWYGKRRGEEQRALNEFVQRHTIEELIKLIEEQDKEFIRLLKEEFLIEEEEAFGIRFIIEAIDKLAGNKLI